MQNISEGRRNSDSLRITKQRTSGKKKRISRENSEKTENTSNINKGARTTILGFTIGALRMFQ